MKKQIRLMACAMNCDAHQSPGLWTHPRDRTAEYNRLPYWIDLAKTLERGRFDGLFLADVLGVYDVFGGSPDAALRNATQTPANDPLLLIPAMAQVTEHLGFGDIGTPAFEKLHRRIHDLLFADKVETALATADVREKLDTAGCEPMSAPRAQFADIIRSDVALWAKVVKDAGISAD